MPLNARLFAIPLLASLAILTACSKDNQPPVTPTGATSTTAPTPRPANTRLPVTPNVSPSHMEPDTAALERVRVEQAAIGGKTDCNPKWVSYHADNLGMALCYPPTWTLIPDNGPPPVGTAMRGLILSKASLDGIQAAFVSIATHGPVTGRVNCSQPGSVAVGPYTATVCFLQRVDADYNLVPVGSSRIIAVGIPVGLPASDMPEVQAGVELRDYTPSAPTPTFSPDDQHEALSIIASIRFDPRPSLAP